MWPRDKAQHRPRRHDPAPSGIRARVRAWWRGRAGAKPVRRRARAQQGRQALDVRAALADLTARLDGGLLPNGVVELVIDDRPEQLRQLLDIHDGRIESAEPGSIVPWASIAGSRCAWARALRDGAASELSLAGEVKLAQCVLVALTCQPGLKPAEDRSTAV